jgi:hypothetical protein
MRIGARRWEIFLAAAGIAFGFLVFELSCRIFWGPADKAISSQFKNHYLETDLRNTQNWAGAGRQASDKLVFLAGESIAQLCDERYFSEYFSIIFPQYNWRVVNEGKNGSDSYYISLIVKKLAEFKPDLLILLMGNNDPTTPARVWALPYTSPVLKRLWSPRLLSRAFGGEPSVKDQKGREAYFEKYFKVILDTAKRRGIPVAVCVMPQNVYEPDIAGYRCFTNASDFEVWWLTQKKPERIAQRINCRRYFPLKALESLGNQRLIRQYYEAIPKNVKRREMMARTAGAIPGNIVIRFDTAPLFLGYGYRFFTDGVHFWPPVYEYVAAEVSVALHEKGPSLGLEPDEKGWRRFEAMRPSKADIERKSAEAMRSTIINRLNTALSPDILLYGDPYNGTIDCMRFAWRTLKDSVPWESEIALSAAIPDSEKKAYCGRLVMIAEMFREEKEYGRALKYFDQAARLNPNDAMLLLFRGLYHRDINDLARAESDFRALAKARKEAAWLTCAYLDSIER